MVAMDDNKLAFATEGSVVGWLTHELEQGRLGSALMLGTISIYILLFICDLSVLTFGRVHVPGLSR